MRKRFKQLGLLTLISALICVWLWGHQANVNESLIHKPVWFDLKQEQHCHINLIHKCGKYIKVRTTNSLVRRN